MKKIIYVDEFSRVELSRNTTAALSRTKRAIEVLKEAGLPITEDTITECVCMERKEKLVPISEQSMEGPGVETLKLCRTIVTFEGCPTLCKAIEEKVVSATQSKITTQEQIQTECDVSNYFEGVLTKIYEIVESGSIDYSVFQKAFYLENGEIRIDEEKKAKECIEQSTIYAESEKALKAMEIHKKVADALNDFIKFLGEKYQPIRATEILTITNEGVVPTHINYNKYLSK